MTECSAQTGRQFFVVGEATCRFLREREPAVNPDFEDATARSAKSYFRRGSQLEDQFPRRTGARLIASLAAIFDLDFHDIDLANFNRAKSPYQKAVAIGRHAFRGMIFR